MPSRDPGSGRDPRRRARLPPRLGRERVQPPFSFNTARCQTEHLCRRRARTVTVAVELHTSPRRTGAEARARRRRGAGPRRPGSYAVSSAHPSRRRPVRSYDRSRRGADGTPVSVVLSASLSVAPVPPAPRRRRGRSADLEGGRGRVTSAPSSRWPASRRGRTAEDERRWPAAPGLSLRHRRTTSRLRGGLTGHDGGGPAAEGGGAHAASPGRTRDGSGPLPRRRVRAEPGPAAVWSAAGHPRWTRTAAVADNGSVSSGTLRTRGTVSVARPRGGKGGRSRWDGVSRGRCRRRDRVDDCAARRRVDARARCAVPAAMVMQACQAACVDRERSRRAGVSREERATLKDDARRAEPF